MYYHARVKLVAEIFVGKIVSLPHYELPRIEELVINGISFSASRPKITVFIEPVPSSTAIPTRVLLHIGNKILYSNFSLQERET